MSHVGKLIAREPLIAAPYPVEDIIELRVARRDVARCLLACCWINILGIVADPVKTVALKLVVKGRHDRTVRPSLNAFPYYRSTRDGKMPPVKMKYELLNL